MEHGGGLPGLRGVEHIGFTVPDLEEATRFFVDVIGCEYFYSLGPIEDAEGDWMVRHLNVPARTRVRELRFFRCGFGPNFEIFEYDGDGRNAVPPRNCDVGGHHLAFYVDDFDLALAHLKRHGLRILGEPTVRATGPSAWDAYVLDIDRLQFAPPSDPTVRDANLDRLERSVRKLRARFGVGFDDAEMRQLRELASVPARA